MPQAPKPLCITHFGSQELKRIPSSVFPARVMCLMYFILMYKCTYSPKRNQCKVQRARSSYFLSITYISLPLFRGPAHCGVRTLYMPDDGGIIFSESGNKNGPPSFSTSSSSLNKGDQLKKATPARHACCVDRPPARPQASTGPSSGLGEALAASRQSRVPTARSS